MWTCGVDKWPPSKLHERRQSRSQVPTTHAKLKDRNVGVVGVDSGVPISVLVFAWCSTPIIPKFVEINQDPCDRNLEEGFQKGGCPGSLDCQKQSGALTILKDRPVSGGLLLSP